MGIQEEISCLYIWNFYLYIFLLSPVTLICRFLNNFHLIHILHIIPFNMIVFIIITSSYLRLCLAAFHLSLEQIRVSRILLTCVDPRSWMSLLRSLALLAPCFAILVYLCDVSEMTCLRAVFIWEFGVWKMWKATNVDTYLPLHVSLMICWWVYDKLPLNV